MQQPPKGKPSLNDLFDSKRLDHPDKEFWESFQTEFRSKVLTSIVRNKNRSNTFLKYSASAACLLLCSASFVFFFSKQDKSAAQQTGVTLTQTDKNQYFHDAETLISLNLIQEAKEAESFDSFNEPLNDFIEMGLFVENSFRVSSLETSFQHRVLNSSINLTDNELNQFSF
jgi:hypothetical protein